MNVVLDNLDALLLGAAATVAINAAGFGIGAFFGIVISFIERGAPAPVRWLVRSYVEFIRNTPFLLQAMLLFALLATFRIRLDPFIPGALALTLYTAAYMIEIMRGAFASVNKGQEESAAALALNRIDTFRFVVFPQMLPFVLPASVNLAATAVKESSVLAAVAVAELTYRGQLLIGQTFAAFEIWAAVGFIYLIIVLGIIGAAHLLEARLNRWSRKQAAR